jgi:hypothetical protein
MLKHALLARSNLFSFSGFPPEKEFLEKLKGIDGVSTIETQTITNMEI